MRRFLLLCPCLLLLLAACGGSKGAPAGNTNAPASQVKTSIVAGSTDVALQNVSYFTDGEGEIFYIGEVTNTSKVPVSSVKISLLLVDGSGTRLAKATFLNPGLPLLQPGEKSAWKLFVGKPPSGWAETQASVQLDPDDESGETFVPLPTQDVALVEPGQIAWVTGKGRVLNPTGEALQGVLLIVGLYDGSGKLLDVANGIPESKQLSGNSATSFTAEFRNTKQIPKSFKVFAMGTR